VGAGRDSQLSLIIVLLVRALIDSTSSSRRSSEIDGCRHRRLIRFRRTSDQPSVGLKACEAEHRVNGTADRSTQLPNNRLPISQAAKPMLIDQVSAPCAVCVLALPSDLVIPLTCKDKGYTGLDGKYVTGKRKREALFAASCG